MKSIIRSFLINLSSLWLVSQIGSGFYLKNGYETLFLTAFVLGLVNLFIRPLINILLLPINILTLGMLRWTVNVITLYLVTLIVQDFKILSFNFPGISFNFLNIPSFSSTGILAFLLTSFILSFISGFLFWLVK